jgi:hypothetical protein
MSVGGLNRGEDSHCDVMDYDTVLSGRFVTTFQRKTLPHAYHEDGGSMITHKIFDNNA